MFIIVLFSINYSLVYLISAISNPVFRNDILPFKIKCLFNKVVLYIVGLYWNFIYFVFTCINILFPLFWYLLDPLKVYGHHRGVFYTDTSLGTLDTYNGRLPKNLTINSKNSSRT